MSQFELDKRKKHINEMVSVYNGLVGSIYPAYMYRDIVKQKERYVAAGGDPNDLPFVNPPGPDGRVNSVVG